MSKYIFTKSSKLLRPKNISEEQFVSASYGDIFEYEPEDNPVKIYHFSGSNAFNNEEYLFLRSLKNIIDRNKAKDDIFNYNLLKNQPITLVALSSAHFGSGIDKGTVQLNYFLSGNLLAEASDYREDGIIYSGSAENTGSNTAIGFALYNEGFIVINNNQILSGTLVEYSSSYNGSFYDYPRWNNALACSSSNLISTLDYGILGDLETHMHFVYADKYQFNHSNNPTYIKSGSYSYTATNNSFIESETIEIKNTVKSPFISGSATQDKQTFISKIGLYDKNKKLLAIASLANPIRKTENREFVFKLKLDI